MRTYLSCIAAIACLNTSVAQDALSESEFDRIHSELRINANALWRTIPWETSLLKAQAMAARERKPIFLWSMNGNPLGCT